MSGGATRAGFPGSCLPMSSVKTFTEGYLKIDREVLDLLEEKKIDRQRFGDLPLMEGETWARRHNLTFDSLEAWVSAKP